MKQGNIKEFFSDPTTLQAGQKEEKEEVNGCRLSKRDLIM